MAEAKKNVARAIFLDFVTGDEVLFLERFFGTEFDDIIQAVDGMRVQKSVCLVVKAWIQFPVELNGELDRSAGFCGIWRERLRLDKYTEDYITL